MDRLRPGRRPVREPSLASRTGLVDQGTGLLWPQAWRRRACPPGFSSRGTAATARPGSCGTTVSFPRRWRGPDGGRHDHPGGGRRRRRVGADELFNSSGTADVLARSIPGTLPEAERQQVVTAYWSSVPRAAGCQPAPGRDQRRAAAAARAGRARRGGRAYRSALDHASLSVGDLPAYRRSAATAGPRTTSSCASRTPPRPPRSDRRGPLYGGGSPAPAHRHREGRLPHRRAGRRAGRRWPVRVAKSAVIDALSFSPVIQPGVTGAALLASYALAGGDLAGFIREGTQ